MPCSTGINGIRVSDMFFGIFLKYPIFLLLRCYINRNHSGLIIRPQGFCHSLHFTESTYSKVISVCAFLAERIFMKRCLFILLQCTWGCLQTLVGAVIFLCHPHRNYSIFHGAVVSCWGMRYSASVGMFLFISERDAHNQRLLVHEYGHTVQSLLLGPLYPLLIGLPSMLWMMLPCCRHMRKRKHLSYYAFYTERWANHLGEKICRAPSMGMAYID